MKYLVDIDKLFLKLKPMSLERRGAYISHQVFAMLNGNCEESWALEQVKPKRTLPKVYTDCFELFWEAYPARKGVRGGKRPAFQSWWTKAADFPDERALLALCLEALEWQKKQPTWNEEQGAYVPMAQTYLNQRRWEDEKTEPDSKGGYTDMDGVWHE